MSLAAEIVAALPSLMKVHPQGPRVDAIADFVAASPASVRKAFAAIKADASAIVVRYPGSKARHVVPLGHDFGFHRAAVCPHCDLLFERPRNSKRRCCSQRCGTALSWTKPDVAARRTAGIRAERETIAAKARLAAHNDRRWKSPEARAQLSEQNRRNWADPVKRAKRAAAIQKAHGTKESRKRYSDMRREMWADPDYRKKAIAGMRAAHQTEEHRRAASERMKKRWRDPVQREKLTKACAGNLRKNGDKVVGKKQSPEHVAKRIASRKANAKQHGHWRHRSKGKGR